jgi:hypothetical protein
VGQRRCCCLRFLFEKESLAKKKSSGKGWLFLCAEEWLAQLRYTQGELEGMILAAARNIRNGSRRFNARGVSEQNGQQNAKFSVAPVWTGSAADYDKPSLHYVGSGEGQQVYG